MIPTGGVDAGNAAAFLEAGAVAVGVGGAILRADAAGRRAIVAAVAGAGGAWR
jgi:2-dehydro-3-deoxyphosphogluconate aldolase/(4S)-4-hydroxy-2-oxoglutarate aldolase